MVKKKCQPWHAHISQMGMIKKNHVSYLFTSLTFSFHLCVSGPPFLEAQKWISFKIFSGRKIKKGTTGRFDCSVVNIPSFS